MPNLNPGRFAHPEMLRQIRVDLLLAWLGPARHYLSRRGLDLPQPDAGAAAPLDYDRLASLFLEPTPDMPPDLLESLYLFRELEAEPAMDALRAEARRTGVDLGVDASATPLDVVVRAWTLDRPLVEGVRQRLELSRPRSFQYFSAAVAPPPFAGPTPEQLAALERRLNLFYEAWKRGKGARVFPSHQQDDWFFLVRHGAPCRREGTMEKDEPAAIFYRPQRYDVLKYDARRGELAVNCCGQRERRILLRLFGGCLFGRPDFFPTTAKYTLAPLMLQGRNCLACGDVPGLERVSLTEVELHSEDEPRHREIRQAKDLFKLVEAGRFAWPPDAHQIKRATFEVKFCRAPRPRRFTIVPCNRVLFGREEDSPTIEKLMRARGFTEGRRDEL